MRTLVLAVLLVFGTRAMAIQPESGWWWYEPESGRGFTVEVQNNYLFFAGYLYAQNGAPTWYVAQGAFDHAASRFSAPLLSFANGQCLTCPYIPPVQTASPGQVTLTFSSPIAGSLTWPGGTIPIKRIIYGTTDDYRRIAGQWVYTAVISSITTSDWLNLNQTLSSGGQNYVVGTIQGNRTVLGGLSAGSFGVLIDSSTSYYDFYSFPATQAGVVSFANGREWLYLKTSSLSGPGSPAQAFKYGPAPTSLTSVPNLATPESAKVAGMIEAFISAAAAAKQESLSE